MARPRCPICRSKKWHKDRSSGLVVCEEGHILQGYVQENIEAEGVAAHVTRRRKLRKNKVTKVGRTANLDLFHGPKLKFLFFQCAQILLRKQIQALIAFWDLPSEFETVARDLWAMYVSLTNLEAEPFKHDDDKDAVARTEQDAKNMAEDPLQQFYDHLSDSSTGSEDNEYHNSHNEKGHRPSEDVKKRSREDGRDGPIGLRLEYTLVICYLACISLRLPVMTQDILDMAESYKIPYLEALECLPTDMLQHIDMRQMELSFLRSRVTPNFVDDESTRLRGAGFVFLVESFANRLSKDYGICPPRVNAAPILWRSVQMLGLPPFFYLAARRLLILLKADFAVTEARPRFQDGKLRGFPDAIFAASLLVTAKLLWGADGKTRMPQDADDMAAGLPRLEGWLDMAERLQADKRHVVIPEGARSSSMSKLSKDEIDEFLDFFQTNVHSTARGPTSLLGTLPQPANAPPAAERYFPLNFIANNAETRVSAAEYPKLDEFYRNLSTPIPGEAVDEDPLFPGEGYVIWNAYDVDGVSHASNVRLVSLIGAVTGIKNKALEAAVVQVERALLARQDPRGRIQLSKGTKPPLEGVESRKFGKLYKVGTTARQETL